MRSRSNAILAVGLWLLCTTTFADTYSEQRAKLESLSAEQKEQLQRKKDRFDALPETEQARLRELHASVASDPKADELLAVMSRYNEWLKSLSSATRTELLSLPADQRVKRIKELKQEQEKQRFREYANNLPESDMNLIYAWLEEFVASHEEEFLRPVPREFRRRIEELDETNRRKALMRSLLWRRPGDNVPTPSQEEVLGLVSKLSQETQNEIARAKTAEEKTFLARHLVAATIASKVFPQVTDEQRQKLFARLSSVERERLEQMSPEMMRRELNRMYHAEQFRNRDGSRGGPPGFGGSRFGPEPREGDHGPERRDDRRGPQGWDNDRRGPGRDGPPRRGPGGAEVNGDRPDRDNGKGPGAPPPLPPPPPSDE